MAFIDRLKEARLKNGLTQEKLAKEIGVAKSTYTGYEKGNSEPNMLVLSKIMDVLGVDANYLYQDEVRMRYETRATPQEMETLVKKYRALDRHGKEMVDIVMDKETERIEADRLARAAELLKESRSEMEAAAEPTVEIMYFSVPYQLHPMSAGTGTESDEEYTENLRLIKEPPYGTSYVARVSGDSMEPTYNNGDLVFVHSAVEIREGQVGVFLMDGQQWIKELGDGVLISHNDEYEPRRMTPDVRCQGRVLGVCDDSYFEK